MAVCSQKMSSFLKRAAAVAVGLAAVFAAGGVEASTITVGPSGKNYTDVLSAVTAAKAAIAGGETSVAITVDEGEYPLTAQIDLDGPITITGAGAGKTILKRDTSVSSMRIAYLHHADAVIEKATIRDGYLTESGSGPAALITAGTVRDCEVTNCRLNHWNAGWSAGSCVKLDGADARLLRCSLHGNSSGFGAGLAIYVIGQGVADSCLVYANESSNGNAGNIVYVKGGTVRNCTIVDNYLPSSKTIVQVENDTNTHVIDCVICANRGAPQISGATSKCVNTVLVDPGFANIDTGDYRLWPSSTYVDTGADGSASQSAYDITGVTPRKCDAAVDPGAYEANRSSTPACHFMCSDRENLEGEAFTLDLYNANGGDTCTYTIDWGDGTAEQVQGVTASHAYTKAGVYEVKLSIPGAAVYARPDFLSVKAKCIYVAKGKTPVSPYDDPEKATPNIEDAVDAASDGSVILVAPDATPYKFSKAAQLAIRKNIQVIGQTNDPTQVVFEPKTANGSRLFLLGHAKAKLFNLTLQGGYSGSMSAKAGCCVYIESTGGTVSNCVLRNVSDTSWGNCAAGLYIAAGAGLVTHCVLSNLTSAVNSSGVAGMSAYLDGGSMENCLITKNTGSGTADINSCGVVALAGTSRLVNCTIAGNTLSGPSGVSLRSSTAKVINCVIANNKSTGLTDGTAATYGYASSLTEAQRTACFTACATEIDINNTCYKGNLGFVDKDKHDYHLTVGSSAKDHGVIPSGYELPATDLDGNTRVINDTIDIGCYELEVSGVAASFAASAAKGTVPCQVTFTAEVASAEPDECTYKWDVFGDGSKIVETDEPELVYDYTTNGNFTVRLTVVKDSKEYPASNTLPFYGYPKNLYVNGASTSPEAPYGTPAKAAKTIATALAEANDGSVIHVSSGTYTIAESIALAKGVSIVGETGKPEDVRIRQSGSNWRAFYLNHADAKVCNLAIEDFSSGGAYGAGACIDTFGGTVSNCVIRGCKANGWGTAGGGICVSGPGLVTHCVISNCQSSADAYTSGYGGSAAAVVSAGMVRNCLMIGNTVASGSGEALGGVVAVSGGTVENCTLFGNTNKFCGGIYCKDSGKAINCVIAGGTVLLSGQPATAAAWSGTAANFENCVVDVSVPNGTCVTDLAPFKDSAAGDFRLGPKSKALRFGALRDWMTGATDLRGRPRVTGTHVNAGCYENGAGGFTVIIR